MNKLTLYHLTTVDLAVDAIRRGALESKVERFSSDLCKKGMSPLHVDDAIELTFPIESYDNPDSLPFYDWFEDRHLIYTIYGSPRRGDPNLLDEHMSAHLVRFQVSVHGYLFPYNHPVYRPTIISSRPPTKEGEYWINRQYIGIPSFNLKHATGIDASPRAQGRIRAAIAEHGSDALRSLPVNIIHLKGGVMLYEIKL